MERKAALKEIDQDNNGKMALIEYTLWKFKKSVGDVANAAQGEDKEALERCQKEIEEVQAALRDVQDKLEAQKQALAAQKAALAEQQRVVAEVNQLVSSPSVQGKCSVCSLTNNFL